MQALKTLCGAGARGGPDFSSAREIAISYAPGQDQLQTVRCYTLFFPGGRVYAGDTRGHLIAVALVSGRQGRYSYTLEGNGVTGSGFDSAAALLEGVASQLSAAFLEAQFRAMPDLAKADVFDLTAGPHLNLRLPHAT